MTLIVTDQPTSFSYTATAGQSVFPVTCRIFDGYLDDFIVRVDGVLKTYNAAPVGASQWNTTQAGGGAEGGTINFGSGLTLGQVVTIDRRMSLERLSQFPESAPVDMATVNAELSRIVAMIQDVARPRQRFTMTLDLASLPPQSRVAIDMPATGVRLSKAQVAMASLSISMGSLIANARIESDDVVRVMIYNLSSTTAVDLASCTITAFVYD